MILSDIAALYDCPHSTAPDEGEGYPLIRTPNVGKGRLILDGVHRVSREVYDLRNKRAIPQENDIIFAREAPAGNAAVIVKDQFVCLGQRTVLIRSNPQMVDSHYLTYYLLAPQQQIKLLGFSHGATVGHVNIPDLAKLPVVLPELSKQKAIAGIIELYDNLIETNNKRIKVLEQMAENLYKEWFVRFRFPGHEAAVFENGTPKGWERARISKYYITSSGGTPSRETEVYYDNGTIPWIKTGEMQDCLLIETEEKITEEAVKKSSAKLFPKDSVLMAMYGVNIGKLAYSTMDATCNQACCVFKDRMGINTKHYLFHCLMSIRDYLLLISFGAAQQNLSQDLIKRIRILRPDDATLTAFERAIEPLYIERKHLLGLNSKLIKQRDLLLPRLMSGRLEV